MREASMDTTQTGTPSPATPLGERHAARLNACWPGVRVDSVQVVPMDAGKRLRALVQLGGLAPADVRVELVPATEAEDERIGTHEGRWMFSSHSLANGCFAFDVTLPLGDSALPDEWVIHVHPIEAHEEPRVEHRFRVDW